MTPETALVFGTDIDNEPEPDTRTEDERGAEWAELRREIDLDTAAMMAMDADRANAVDGWFVAPFDSEPW